MYPYESRKEGGVGDRNDEVFFGRIKNDVFYGRD